MFAWVHEHATPYRLTVVVGILVFAVNLPSFISHARYFLSGAVTENLITGNWVLVVVNIVLFLGFLYFLTYRRSIDWSQRAGMGVYAAFIVSLFVEMYGIPLTIFLGSGVIGAGTPPDYLVSLSLFGTTLAMNAWMMAGVGITVVGMVMVAAGWYQVYRADGLVTSGLYRYSRNPQYLGILLIAAGWVIGWPTVLTLLLFPVLVIAYIHLARVERRDMREAYGDAYESYAADTPLIL